MSLKVRHVAALVAWGAATFGVLQFGTMEGMLDSCAICGPWGCGPPTEALIAAHGFWLMVYLLLGTAATLALSPRKLRLLGLIFTALGLLTLSVIVGWVLVTWLPQTSAMTETYIVQRTFFVIATLVDVPVAETLLAGIAIWILGSRRVRHERQVEGRSP